MKYLLILFLFLACFDALYCAAPNCIMPGNPCRGINARCCSFNVCVNGRCLAMPKR
uniref:Venom ptu1 family peptide pp5 n=1 Tax=Pristhesancus plagipennis TaxID=1955184 RepID=A0A1Q1NPE6_PRIPG|nr:venom ptu1 family peptide pp5 [Pristhesancus plagipennis]